MPSHKITLSSNPPFARSPASLRRFSTPETARRSCSTAQESQTSKARGAYPTRRVALASRSPAAQSRISSCTAFPCRTHASATGNSTVQYYVMLLNTIARPYFLFLWMGIFERVRYVMCLCCAGDMWVSFVHVHGIQSRVGRVVDQRIN